MKKRFTAVLEEGHKGAAVLVPFDPAKAWGTVAKPIHSPVYGKAMMGHTVRGTLAGRKFTGWIGHRWGRHFILVDEALQRAAGISPGQSVEVAIEPGEPGSATGPPSGGKPRSRRTRGQDSAA